MDWILERKRNSRRLTFSLTKDGQGEYRGHTCRDRILLQHFSALVLKSLALEHTFCLLGWFFWVKAPWQRLGLSPEELNLGETRFLKIIFHRKYSPNAKCTIPISI